MTLTEEKIIVTSAENAEHSIGKWLDKGWMVKSVTAEHVAISEGSHRDRWKTEIAGSIIFILHRNLTDNTGKR